MTNAPVPRASADGIELVAPLARIEAFADEWWALWHADAHATPFQSPAWLLPWARHYAPDRFMLLAARERGALVALVPLFAWQGALLLGGTGPSDYGDALVAASAGANVTQDLLDALAATAAALGCSEIDLRQLRERSVLLDGSAPRGWRDTLDADLPCPVATLRDDDAFAGTSAHWRRNLRRAQRLLGEAGAETGALEDAEVETAAAQLERLHRQRWLERGEDGVIDERMQRFLREAIPALHAARLLRFQRVRHDGEFAAAAFAMRGNDAVHCFLGGFDPAWARCSPGVVVLAAAMQAAAREGLREFHLLRGREAYKYGFGAEDRATSRRRLSRTARAVAVPT